MIALSESLLRVMYAPLDYIHPARFKRPATHLSNGMQQAVNHQLIKQYQLPTHLDFSVGAGDFSQRLVSDWNLLRTVAWLLGCKLARGSLAIGGKFAALPEMARQFIALPVACPAYASNAAMDNEQLEVIGARYLYQLKSQLPAALAERLPLVFAPDAEQEDPAMPPVTLNRSLFTFAFDYAKNSRH